MNVEEEEEEEKKEELTIVHLNTLLDEQIDQYEQMSRLSSYRIRRHTTKPFELMFNLFVFTSI